VDPLGSLITVSYTAGPEGYVENRKVQEGFLLVKQQVILKLKLKKSSLSQFLA